MEEYRTIIGFENYEVSNLGNVRSKGFDYMGENNIRCVIYPRILKFNKVYGYNAVGIKKDKINHTIRVHRLVGFAFIPNPENKPQINHKNGIRDDNRVENLEWNTAKENINHSFKVLKRIPNMKNVHNGYQSKVVFKKSIDGEIISQYVYVAEAGRQNNINRRSIYSSISKNTMTHGYYWCH